jgi:hypothetical protein
MRDERHRAYMRESSRSEAQRSGDRDHRSAGVNRFDDLGVIDPLQVHACDAEVAAAELALDDDQRHAFTRGFDGVGMAELMRREAGGARPP